MVICTYCEKNLSNVSSLNYHQRTAKYCIAKQGNQANVTNFACEMCDKKFTAKETLMRHTQTCGKSSFVARLNDQVALLSAEILQYKTIITERDNTISILRTDMQVLHAKNQELALAAICKPTTTTTTTTTNNYIQRLEMVTDEHFKSQASNLTIDHIQKGADGYAEYALEYPLKDRVVCVDYSRRKVKYKDSNGKVQTDPEMGELATKLFQSIKDKNKELIMTYGNELQDRFGDKMGTIVELLEHKTNVDKGSEGEKSDLYLDVVKAICGKTVV